MRRGERRTRRSGEGFLARLVRNLTSLVLALACLAAQGCSGTTDPHDTVRVAVIGTVDSLSPVYNRAPEAQSIEKVLFRGFLEWASDGRLRTEWATSVPSVASKSFRGNAQTAFYTLQLRPDAKWSDGEAVTYDDFMFTYRLLLHPLFKKGHGWWTSFIRSFTIAGDSVTFNVDRSPTHDGLDLFPLPRHLLEGPLNSDALHFADLPFNTNPIGDGPYKLRRRTYNSVELERNPLFAPRPAKVGRVVFQFYANADDAWAAINRNAVDVIDGPPPSTISNAGEGGTIAVKLTPGPRLVNLVFNTRKAPFDDLDLRRALAHGAERTQLVKTLGPEVALSTQSWLQPTRFSYIETFASYRGELEAAQRSLAASHWAVNGGRLVPAGGNRPTNEEPNAKPASDSLELSILYDSDSPDMQAAATALQKSWKRLGLNAALIGRPRPSYLAELHQGAFTVALQDLEVYPWTEPSAYFAEESIPTERNNFHGENVSGWTAPQNKALLARIAAESSPAAAAPLVRDQERLLARDVPIVPLYFTPLATAWRDGLTGIDPRSFGGITWNVEEWSWK